MRRRLSLPLLPQRTQNILWDRICRLFCLLLESPCQSTSSLSAICPKSLANAFLRSFLRECPWTSEAILAGEAESPVQCHSSKRSRTLSHDKESNNRGASELIYRAMQSRTGDPAVPRPSPGRVTGAAGPAETRGSFTDKGMRSPPTEEDAWKQPILAVTYQTCPSWPVARCSGPRALGHAPAVSSPICRGRGNGLSGMFHAGSFLNFLG